MCDISDYIATLDRELERCDEAEERQWRNCVAQFLCQNIMGLYSSPLRIVVAMSLLYTQLGPASLVALGTLILFMPLQARSCDSLWA